MRVISEANATDALLVPQAFCRLMLQTSLLAIPVYLGLFLLAVPFDMDAGKLKGAAMGTPVVIFLLAAIAYATGFLATLPDRRSEPDVVMSGRRQIMRRKLKLIAIGSGFFTLGVTLGTLLLIKAHL